MATDDVSALRRLYETSVRLSSPQAQIRMSNSIEQGPDGKIRFKRPPPFEVARPDGD